MIQPRSYNTTYFRPKQQCNAILVEVVCLSTIGLKYLYVYRQLETLLIVKTRTKKCVFFLTF